MDFVIIIWIKAAHHEGSIPILITLYFLARKESPLWRPLRSPIWFRMIRELHLVLAI